MGNSEVGHNALGSGRVCRQGAGLVDDSIKTGDMYQGPGWAFLKDSWSKGGTFHFIGLLSDGGVHSRTDQLRFMMEQYVVEANRNGNWPVAQQY